LHGWFFPLGVVGPLACFLLVDGEWCDGDCALIACILFPISIMIFIARAEEWLPAKIFRRDREVALRTEPALASLRSHPPGRRILATWERDQCECDDMGG
jgi:hypothetical protein